MNNGVSLVKYGQIKVRWNKIIFIGTVITKQIAICEILHTQLLWRTSQNVPTQTALVIHTVTAVFTVITIVTTPAAIEGLSTLWLQHLKKKQIEFE